MPDNQILNQIKNDPELAQQVMNHLLTEGELFYETLDADKPLRQELLTEVLERYCLSQAEFAEKTGAENARITRDVSNGILTPVHIFGDKKYYYTRLFWKEDVKNYAKYVEVTSYKSARKVKEKLIEKAEEREVKRKTKE
jgi:Trp operon repressor